VRSPTSPEREQSLACSLRGDFFRRVCFLSLRTFPVVGPRSKAQARRQRSAQSTVASVAAQAADLGMYTGVPLPCLIALDGRVYNVT
jgi:hypothetical protein